MNMTTHQSDESLDKESSPVERREQLNKYLRELREEVRDLSDFCGKVKSGLTNVSEGEGYIRKTFEDISSLVLEIEKVNSDLRSDTVRHIFNIWEQMQANPILVDPTQDLPQQAQLHALTLLEDCAAQIIFSVGSLTIPHRVNKWLEKARTGYYLAFHQHFEDELPNPHDRLRVLRNIAAAPKALKSGIVTSHSGLIYRYEPNALRRFVGIVMVCAFFLFATTLVWAIDSNILTGLSPYIPLDAHVRELLFPAWLSIILGIIIHVAVAGVKRNAQSGLPPVIAVNDWSLLFSARKGDVVIKIVLALIGLFGFAVIVGKDQFTVTSAFFVGYSLDSFIGLFSDTMERKASAQLSIMEKNVNINRNS